LLFTNNSFQIVYDKGSQFEERASYCSSGYISDSNDHVLGTAKCK